MAPYGTGHFRDRGADPRLGAAWGRRKLKRQAQRRPELQRTHPRRRCGSHAAAGRPGRARVDPDGRSVRTLINVTPIRTEGGLVRSAVATLQDLAPFDEVERMRTEFLGLVTHERR